MFSEGSIEVFSLKKYNRNNRKRRPVHEQLLTFLPQEGNNVSTEKKSFYRFWSENLIAFMSGEEQVLKNSRLSRPFRLFEFSKIHQRFLYFSICTLPAAQRRTEVTR